MVSRSKNLIGIFAAVAVLMVMSCAIAIAADDDAPVTLDLKDVDVKAAIESLFRGTGRNFSIAQDVDGTIPSLSFRNVPFNQALKNLLKTAGLVYRVENSVYMINKKPDVTATTTTTQTTTTETETKDDTTTEESVIDKVPLNNMGASEILSIMSGSNNQNGGYGNSSYGGYGGGMGMGMGMGMSGGLGMNRGF